MSEESRARGESTREQIIKAAHDLFVKQGYHGTSMRQIAKRADVALGGLYNHFASKEEVFQAVFLEFHPYHEVIPALEAAQGETVKDFVRDAAYRMLKALERRPHFLQLMFIEMVEFENMHSRELFATLLPMIVKKIERVSRDKIDQLREIPIPILIRTFLGLFFSYYLTELIISPDAPAEFRDHAMDYYIDIYLHGILRE